LYEKLRSKVQESKNYLPPRKIKRKEAAQLFIGWSAARPQPKHGMPPSRAHPGFKYQWVCQCIEYKTRKTLN